MSTRLIYSEGTVGIDQQIEDIQTAYADIITDDAFFHDFLSENAAIVTAALTRLTIENINIKNQLANLVQAEVGEVFGSTTIVSAPLDYPPSFNISAAPREYDFLVQSAILASSTELILADTGNGTFNVILPTNAPIGTTVSVVDYTQNFAFNNIIITTNGSQQIQNSINDLVISLPNLYNFIYTGEQYGWTLSNDGSACRLVFVKAYYKVLNNDKVLADASAGSYTLFLNDNPNQYDTFTVIDVAGKFDVNPITVDGNGKLILGSRGLTLDVINISISFIYKVNRWLYVEDLPHSYSNIKSITADTTAINNDYLFIGASLIITLDGNPNTGDQIVLVDDCDESANTVTLNPNGKLINGDPSNLILDIKYSSFTLFYVSPAKGWLIKG